MQTLNVADEKRARNRGTEFCEGFLTKPFKEDKGRINHARKGKRQERATDTTSLSPNKDYLKRVSCRKCTPGKRREYLAAPNQFFTQIVRGRREHLEPPLVSTKE